MWVKGCGSTPQYDICLLEKTVYSVDIGFQLGCFKFFAMEYLKNIKKGKHLDLNPNLEFIHVVLFVFLSSLKQG